MKTLYMLYPNSHIEDYVFAYENNPADAVQAYCKVCELPAMTLDEFWKEHSYDEINEIDNRRIKEIIFE